MVRKTSSESGKPSPDAGKPPTNAISTRVTVVQGAKVATTWSFYAIIAGVCVASTYFIVNELMPSKMSPNSIFNESFKLVEINTDVINMFGSPIKAYGTDYGGHKAGRRYHIKNTLHTDDAGIEYRRILYSIEGPSGQLGNVYVEKTSSQGDGDFVYIIVEDKRSGRTIPVIDNRETVPIDTIQSDLIDKLNSKGIILWGGDNEKFTIQQKAQFGRHVHKLKYVNCEQNRAVCEKAGVQGLPSWQVNGRMIIGFRQLDDLKAMSMGATMDE